nr:LytTR family DNA-binding domain-containing protein [uncultured Allomuricauda sp.]
MINEVKISYVPILRWNVIALVTLIAVLVIVGVYYLHPSNIYWYKRDDFSYSNLLQFVLIDQYLIELGTTTIISFSIFRYAKIFGIDRLDLNLKGIGFYALKFLPLFFTVYFISSPFTVGIRFLYHYYVLQRKHINYFDSYFFLNKSLYLSYVLPIVIICSLLLAIAILKAINKSKPITTTEKFTVVPLIVKSEFGEKIISSNSVLSITKEGRKYMVKTDSDKFQINKNLTMLEKELDQNFISINRSTLINLAYFKDYSFWENEKYIIRMTDGQEFNSTRERLKLLKVRLKAYCN